MLFKNPEEKNKVLKPHEIKTLCMKYSIVDILPATTAHVSFMALKKFFLKPDFSVVTFWVSLKLELG